MPWSTAYNPELQVTEIRFGGSLSPQDLAAAFQEALARIQAERQYALLVDCTALESVHSLFHLLDLATELSQNDIARQSKEAVLLPRQPQAATAVCFWETACLNRGLNVRVFEQRKHALDWLLA